MRDAKNITVQRTCLWLVTCVVRKNSGAKGGGGAMQVRHWIYSPGFDPLNHKKTGYVPGTW